MPIIHPGNFPGNLQLPGGSSTSRTTVRSAVGCAGIWGAGSILSIVSIIGMLSGILSLIAGSIDIAAGIIIFIAGLVAENDRRAGKVPSAGAGPGGERALDGFFICAYLLLIVAAIGGLTGLTGPS